MRRHGPALLLLALAPAAAAQDLPATITGDIDGDGLTDKVELSSSAQNPELIDVAITLSAAGRTARVHELGGQQADGAIAKGELRLSFGWYQGRYKSNTSFFIGMQGSPLVVRRYELAVADSISTGPDGTVLVKVCKADFVANRATVDDKPAPPPGPPVAFTAWRDDAVPKACQSLF